MKVIKLPVTELKVALAGLAKVVCNKPSLPVLGSIRVQPQPDGVDLQATDLDTFVTYRVRTDAPPEFPPSLVSYADFTKLVKASKDRVALVHENATAIKFRHFIGRHAVEHPIGCLPVEEWPALPQMRAKPCLVEPGFKEAFRNGLDCASQDASRLILNGACLDISQPDCHCVVASDGRHLFSANTFHFSFTDPVVIPARKFLAWSGFAEDGDWLLTVDQPKNAPSTYVQIQ